MDRVLAEFDDVAAFATATPRAQAWRARARGTGRDVLIKRLPDDGVSGARTRATQALALRHPRIVPARRWMRDGDFFYFVRDWVPGASLRATLADTDQRAFDRLHARLLPLLDGLDYAHEAGLTHGAVSPENVLVDGRVPGSALLSDFGAVPASGAGAGAGPAPRGDLAGLCALYQEFLPARPDDADGAARARLQRNLEDIRQTVQTPDDLRYRLDAVARMAALLGFDAAAMTADAPRVLRGARLFCTVAPSPTVVTPGGGATVRLALDNGGDAPLHIESVTSDAVWLNLPNGFAPTELAPGAGGDLLWTLSAARLLPGTHTATLTLRSNDGMAVSAPPPGASWPEQSITVPVRVRSAGDTDDLDEAEGAGRAEKAGGVVQRGAGGGVPLADSLPHADAGRHTGDHAGIACTQDPDPGLVRYGQNGVLHLGVQNIGPVRLRLDKIRTRPAWLTYPGEFRGLWLEPGETQYLGFSLLGGKLAGGDYKAGVTFTTSTLTDSLLGPQPVWRELSCAVRVRVVRGGGDALPGGLGKTGCAPLLLAATSALGLLCAWLLRGAL